MLPKQALEVMFHDRGFADFRWIDPASVVVAEWVRMKCMFGCGGYGRNGTCPPNVPPVPECGRFFREYSEAVVFHFAKKLAKPEDRHAWTEEVGRRLLDLERDVFVSGHHKAFILLLDSCALCEKCTGRRASCKKPGLARPTPEALAVDVFSTVRAAGYPIQVLSEVTQEMNRYAFLLID
jgi:predicted metal-binding protein